MTNIFIKGFIYELINNLQINYKFDEIKDVSMDSNSIMFSKLLKTDYSDIQISGGIEFEYEITKNNEYIIKNFEIILYKDFLISQYSYLKNRMNYVEEKKIILNRYNVHNIIDNLVKLFRNKMIILDTNITAKLDRLMKNHKDYISK